MRVELIEQMKCNLECLLRSYLEKEGVELFIASNDNTASSLSPRIYLQAIDDTPLDGPYLLAEIRIIMEILGKPFHCDSLIQGVYEALQPHRLTFGELSVLLMTVHVEVLHCIRPRHSRKRTTMRYLVEAV